jgi:hypothetical protein
MNEFDIFIAYAQPDEEYARRLHAVLTAAGRRVFRDKDGLRLGDLWMKRTREAQQGSLATVVLISNRSGSAYFQQEEILAAIDRARNGSHLVMPIYLTDVPRTRVPSPFKQLHSITWREGTSPLVIAQKVDDALRAFRRNTQIDHTVVEKTIVLVTGCHPMPEIYDRPAAYELKSFIDSSGEPGEHAFLHAVVVGDAWFLGDRSLREHPNVVSIGSGGVNTLTMQIQADAQPIRRGPGERWQIVRHGNRWGLFGHRAEDTYDAVLAFKDDELPAFLTELWKV